MRNLNQKWKFSKFEDSRCWGKYGGYEISKLPIKFSFVFSDTSFEVYWNRSNSIWRKQYGGQRFPPKKFLEKVFLRFLVSLDLYLKLSKCNSENKRQWSQCEPKILTWDSDLTTNETLRKPVSNRMCKFLKFGLPHWICHLGNSEIENFNIHILFIYIQIQRPKKPLRNGFKKMLNVRKNIWLKKSRKRG